MCLQESDIVYRLSEDQLHRIIAEFDTWLLKYSELTIVIGVLVEVDAFRRYVRGDHGFERVRSN